MEKSFEEILVQFYVDQYRENAKRSTGKPVKLAHYIHRLNSKAKSIKYARFSKNETIALDKLHQEIKRLACLEERLSRWFRHGRSLSFQKHRA